MQPITKVLLIEDNRLEARQTQHWLAAAKSIAFEVECVDTLCRAGERLTQGGIDIVLLDLNLPDSSGLETFSKLHHQHPQIPIVVLTGEFDDSIGPAAMEQGAQDYLIKQQADAASLTRVLRFAITRHRVQSELLQKSQPVKSARIVGFLGAKGGVGTTTVALNVAVALAARNQSVILVELQAGYGTLAQNLQHQAAVNLSGLLELSADRIDMHALKNSLCRSEAGLRVLMGPQLGNSIQAIEPEQAVAIIQGLGHMADFVILDLPHLPTAATHSAIALSHLTVLVTERECSSIVCGKSLLHLLHEWGIGGHLVGTVVVNRVIYPISLDMHTILTDLGCELIGLVPSDANACLQAQKSGVPLVVSAPNHDIGSSLMEITNRIAAGNVMSKAS